MTIDEAIWLLSESANTGSTTFDERFKEAEKLSIEALKWVKAQRDMDIIGLLKLLPGETEE